MRFNRQLSSHQRGQGPRNIDKMVLPVENPTKSYWIEAAESPLRNFQSTSELPKEADIVIIGSGYTGVTNAYWIHKVGRFNSCVPDPRLIRVLVHRKGWHHSPDADA